MRKASAYDKIVIASCLVLLLPILIISIYNRPSADDYAYTWMTYRALQNGGGFFELIRAGIATDIYFYDHWQGLYSSALLMAFTPSIFDERLYFIGVYIILSSILLCVCSAVRSCETVAGISLSATKRTAFAALISTGIALCMPDATQGLFWYNGAVNYIPYIMLCIANVLLVVSLYFREPGHKKALLLIWATFISFFISGGNHCSSFANILLLGLVLLYFIKKRKRLYAVPPFVSALIGFYLMYRAPGTAARQSGFSSPGAVATIYNAGMEISRNLLSWKDLSVFMLILMCLPYFNEFAIKLDRIKWSSVLAAAAVGFVVICGMQSAPIYAGAGVGEGRLKNVLWIMMLAFDILISFMIYVNLKAYAVPGERSRLSLYAVLFAGLFVLFWNPGIRAYATGFRCLKELTDGRAATLAYMLDERIKLYNSPDNEEITVEPIPEPIYFSILFLTDLSTEPDAYPNFQLNTYYNKRISLSR